MNKKGFTLIELLATLVILSVIMLVAVPSTISILDKNRKESFISDAKRFVALAESEIRNNDKLDVQYGGFLVFTLQDLNDGSFDNDPDGKKYNQTTSFVAVWKKGSATDYQFEYYVQMMGESRGIALKNSNQLERGDIQSVASFDSIEAAIAKIPGVSSPEIKNFADF